MPEFITTTPRSTVSNLLIAALQDTNPQIQAEAALSLAKFGTDGIMALIQALRSKNSQVRQNAAIALAQLPNPSSIPALLEGLQDLDPAVGASVAMALGKQSLTAIKPQLLNLVHDQEPHVRRNTALALGYIADDQGLAVLMDLLKNDPDSYVREGAVTALGRAAMLLPAGD
jgi:HEAT repeat protein